MTITSAKDSVDPITAILSLKSDVTNISPDENITLTWSSLKAYDCVASGDWAGSKATSGSEVIKNVTSNSQFDITCYSPGGSLTDSVAVTVISPTAPTVSLSSSYSSVSYSGVIELSWDSTNAASCSASGGWSGSKATSGTQKIRVISSKVFTLYCSGDGEVVSDSVTVTIVPGDTPKATLSASSTTVTKGESITLSWSSSNSNNCRASGGWSGIKPASGSEILQILTSKNYSLYCSGEDGGAFDTVTITAVPVVTPTLNISASASTVINGSPITLTWVSSNASSCTASGDWSGVKSTSGSETIDSITADSQFTLSCNGNGGSVVSFTQVTVIPEPAPTVRLSASASTILQGGSTTLVWSTNNASSCIASGDWSGVKSLSGSETIDAITADSQFNLSCSGSGGSLQESVEVIVVFPPTISLSASTTTVAEGGSITLSWSSSNTGSCIASGDWSGVKTTSGSETIEAITSDRQFILNCSGAGGSSEGIVAVTVVSPPTVNISASTTSVLEGGSTTLSWNSSNASSCTASGDWNGIKTASGSETIDSITSDSNFIINCIGEGGSADDSVGVIVVPASAPTLSLIATPATVMQGGSTSLSWSSSNAISCEASGDWSGVKNTSGSETIEPITGNSQFTLSCSGDGGTSVSTVDVVVAPAPTISLIASPSKVAEGGSSTLSWYSSNATSCEASGDWSGAKNTSGSETIDSIIIDGEYILSCSGDGGSSDISVAITVVPPPIVTLSTSVSSVLEGESTTLSWSSTDATSCMASGDWNGEKSTSGSETIDSITANSQFILNCSGIGGVSGDSVDVSVLFVPTVSLSASETTVLEGESTKLVWSSLNASSCSASGDWSGVKSISGSETIDSITADSQFILTCIGNGGSSVETVFVSMVPEPPTVSLSASTTLVTEGGSTTLTWETTKASSCTASGDWTGEKSTSGSETIDSITADSQFILSCSGAGGTAEDYINVTTVSPPAPEVSLTATDTSVIVGGSTTLIWTSNNATSCVASGDWSGDKASSGSEIIDSIISDSEFILSCSGAGGTVVDFINIAAVAAPAPTLSLSVSSTTVTEGGSVTLKWSSENSTRCLASGDWSGYKSSSGTETKEAITSDSQFILVCEGSGGTIRDDINVAVVSEAARTATLSWTAPAENTDGTELIDLQGFIIYYGKESGEYTEILDIPFPDSTKYVVTGLTSEQWYFVMTSYNSLGIESAYSNEVSKIIE